MGDAHWLGRSHARLENRATHAFQSLYYRQKFMPNWLRWKHRKVERRWFEPEELVNEDAAYHAGTYLGTLHSFLLLLTLIAMVPIIASTAYPSRQLLKWQNWRDPFCTLALSVAIAAAWVWNAARRRVLEKGLLCISSCAIVWQAVVAAHHRALIDAGDNLLSEKYSKKLGELALELSEQHLFRIEEWISKASKPVSAVLSVETELRTTA